MSTVSLCMIVKNEEEVLARCLESVQGIADEIVIVDTGSTDRTKEIASQYTAKVYDFPWEDDFSAARNQSFSYGTQDYLMWLDADDVLLEEDREILRQWKQDDFYEADVVMLPYHVAFDSQGNVTMSYYRERFFRREKAYRWCGTVHEAIETWGDVQYCTAAVTHRKENAGDPDRNLRIFETMIAKGKLLGAGEKYYYGRELYFHGRYLEAQKMFETFLQDENAWSENCIECCRDLALCQEQQGNDNAAMQSLFRSFFYGEPRAETCCEIGRLFLKKDDPETAAFWYALALTREIPEGGGFCYNDCYGYLPCIQLCICSDRMGDHWSAERYNEMAGQLKPHDEAYLWNKAYFEERNKQNK